MRSLKITLMLAALVAVFFVTVSYNGNEQNQSAESIEKIDLKDSKDIQVADRSKKTKPPVG